MNPVRILLNLLRLPLDLLMWAIDFMRVTRFVFSANEKISERCPFGCYREGNVVKAGLRKCPAARRYGNFWIFRTLCRCAHKPAKPIPGVPAFCQERGNFEISFGRWASILLLALAVGATTVYAVASGFLAHQLKTAAEVTSPSTLRALREVATENSKPMVRVKPVARPSGREVRVDASEVPTAQEPLRNAILQALTSPEDLAVRIRMARGYYALGMSGQARELLESCLDNELGIPRATSLLMIYEVMDGRPELARKRLAAVAGEAKTPPALLPAALLLANAEGESAEAAAIRQRLKGNNDEMTQLILAVVDKTSLPPAAYLGMAKEFPDLSPMMATILELGDEDEVIERLRAVAAGAEVAGQLRGTAILGMWRRGYRDEASRLAEALVRKHPEAAGAQKVRIETLLAAGLGERAEKLSTAALALAGTPADQDLLNRCRARALAQAGRPHEALALWQEIRQRGADPEAEAAIVELRATIDGKP